MKTIGWFNINNSGIGRKILWGGGGGGAAQNVSKNEVDI